MDFKSAEKRVVKLARSYFVESLETPGELLPGPSFSRKKDAIEYAKINEKAVRKRLAEV